MESYNRTVHGGLIGRAPYQVHWDKNLQFDLRNKAAQDAQQNNDAFTKKAEQLTRLGGFRDEVLSKTKFERSFQPKFGDEVHQVQRVAGNVVVDSTGQAFPTRHVMPVRSESANVNTTPSRGLAQRCRP